jgi:hypothetical protein
MQYDVIVGFPSMGSQPLRVIWGYSKCCKQMKLDYTLLWPDAQASAGGERGKG